MIAAPPAKAEARPSIDAGDPVAAALKTWRAERAAADQVPAYVVMWDQHLAGIAARRPKTKRELAGCPGSDRPGWRPTGTPSWTSSGVRGS